MVYLLTNKGSWVCFYSKKSGAESCVLKISLSSSTTILTENVILDFLSNSCGRCFCTGVILCDLEIFCLVNYAVVHRYYDLRKRWEGEQQIWVKY